MPTDTEIVKNRQAGQMQSYGLASATGPQDEAAKLHTVFPFFDKAADAMASTTTSETYTNVCVPYKARIKSIKLNVSATGIAVDATNNATITISKRDAAAANKLTVATYTSNVAGGAVTTGVAKELVLTGANVVVDALSSFTFEISKGGSGVVVPAGRFLIELERV